MPQGDVHQPRRCLPAAEEDEQTRKLVEGDGLPVMFNSLGAATNSAVLYQGDDLGKDYLSGTSDVLSVLSYNSSEVMTQVMTLASDNLTRESVLKQVLNLDMQMSMMLPGIRVKTTPTNYAPVSSMQMQRFDGKSWVLFGDVIQE